MLIRIEVPDVNPKQFEEGEKKACKVTPPRAGSTERASYPMPWDTARAQQLSHSCLLLPQADIGAFPV